MANDFYDDAVDEPEAAAPVQHFTCMIQIEPFDAETEDDEKLRVVGIVQGTDDETFDFIAIKTLENGEMYPTREATVWSVSQKS
ncbi:hypothetical protein H7Q97_18010 [Ochrobactrum sp. CM-21-5]|nr:hypothetical protein [Ochrobactrum sp. CM-21-5]MBC2887278.1 hypothetical protein [Ochrobactrum sp. CM-21-5]